MSYSYADAVIAFESIANEYIKVLRPNETAQVRIECNPNVTTASVSWDTYGVRITLPVRAASSLMTQAEFEDWVSYFLHEMGHPTFTNQADWLDACRRKLARLTNATEDVRMEKALIACGVIPNAKTVLSRLISRKVVEARANGWKPNSRREFGWTLCVLGRAANGYTINADDLAWIKSQIKAGSTVETVLTWALPELDACTSTADCVALSARIMAALAVTQANNPPGNPGEGEAGNPGDDEQGDGEAGEPAEGDGDGEASEGEGEGEGDKGEGDKGEGSKGGKGGKGHGDGSTDADDETPVENDDDLAQHDLAPKGEALTGAEAFNEKRVLDILRDGVMKSQPKTAGSVTRSRGQVINGEALRKAAAQASKQRALLARALRANEVDEREGGRRAGRLDTGALARAAAGATNIFERRETSEGFDTDVCVLLDASGSMAGSNMNSALETGLVIAQAAASVGAPCTVEIFNGTGYVRAGNLAARRTPSPVDFGALTNQAQGGTPLSAHMARVAVAQAKRAGAMRRVVFVVTDGGCDYGPETVKRMAAHLEKTYRTVLAHVSIGTPLQGSFKAEVCVPYGAPLADVGLAHFVKVLQAL